VSAADHYTYRVHWSAEDQEYVGTVAELPSVSWLAPDRMEAFVGIQRTAEEIVAEMQASGEEPPVAIADKRYSGKFQVLARSSMCTYVHTVRLVRVRAQLSDFLWLPNGMVWWRFGCLPCLSSMMMLIIGS
jgi:predicted RNase H-like HicB family nuclease